MPRGKWTNHKGRNRKFTNPEELEEQHKREEKERQWRKERGEPSSEEEGEEDEAKAKASKDKDGSSESEESESESEEDDGKTKGVENLIEISNPNRVQKKAKKLSTLNETLASSTNSKPDLSRKEREELEKQAAQARYQKLHAEGRTEEARADLARLAIVKQQREEAAKKREAEKLQKEAELKTKSAARQKALGKKS